MRRPILTFLLCFILATAIVSPAQSVTTLHSFNGADGAEPRSALVQGTDGNFYGTTTDLGTVFRITPEGTLTTLHIFTGADGGLPVGGLVQGTDGNFYGTTAAGGIYGGDCGSEGCGTVFKITPQGKLTTLYMFEGADGLGPSTSLVQGSDGNFYGTTAVGGIYLSDCGLNGCGTVFKITPQGTLTTLHSFCSEPNCSDGSSPRAALVQASDGNFYGTTSAVEGQECYSDCGTVFRITPSGDLTTLHTFSGFDGTSPQAALVQASDGNFYGTTVAGGRGCRAGCGTVFKITFGGVLTTLYYFFCDQQDCSDGAAPYAGLVQASDGSFYGTATFGGINVDGDGTVFRITPGGVLTTLYKFCAEYLCMDGGVPYAGLVQAGDGKFYGTTSAGGSYGHSCVPESCGTVFVLDLNLDSLSVTICCGSGSITSGDGYINCGAVCSHSYQPGAYVTLTATPAQGWAFYSWTGCDRMDGNSCELTMNQARIAAAAFAPAYLLSVSKAGSGLAISGDGHIYCGSVCSYYYLIGTQIGLTAIPGPGYTLSMWTGCNNVNGNLCLVTMAGAKNVTATFTAAQITLTSLTFMPSYVKGGQLSAGTLTLSAPAPPGGLGVALSSDHPNVAHPPSLVLVPGGKSSIVFGVNTFPVKTNTTVTITATAGNSQVSGTLTVGTSFSQSVR